MDPLHDDNQSLITTLEEDIQALIDTNIEKYGYEVVYDWVLFEKPLPLFCKKKYVHNFLFLFRKHAKGSLPPGTLIYLDKQSDMKYEDMHYSMKNNTVYKTHVLTKEQELITLKELIDPCSFSLDRCYIVQ